MKVAYCSDLHLEFRPIELKNEENADVLILAGDIYLISRMQYDLDDRFKDFMDNITSEFTHVIYVAGNHEYYDSSIYDIEKLRNAVKLYPNVHVLDTQSVTIDGVKFVGGTMWTDINKQDPIAMLQAPRVMNDFTVIGDFSPQYSVDAFNVFNDYIQSRKPVDVVVSHHGPSWDCIAPEYAFSKYNSFYVSNVDVSGVKFWIYGHLHGGNTFEQDGCQILHNSRGYPGEQCFKDFKLKYFVVE
jgi:DNA repair exonuclease SbcCD nuclease subunit